MATIRVVNKSTDLPRVGEVTVYVGRPSVLGNPFPLRHERDRDYVVDQYSYWLAGRLIHATPQRDEVQRLAALVRGGQTVALQCFCYPKRCHADVIKCAMEQLL